MPSLADYRAPYPEAAPGQERKVIYLPAADPNDEQAHLRVQLIIGRHEDCEDGRMYHLTGTISTREIEGWGYNYYVATLGDIYAAHRTPANPENATSFVAMYEKPIFGYNSKLPIVVYVPEGAEVRYRIWSDETARLGNMAPLPPAESASQARGFDYLEELDDGRHEQQQHHRHQQQEDAYPGEAQPDPVRVAEQPQEAEAPRQRGIPALSANEQGRAEEYVSENNAAPVLRASEKANEHEHVHREEAAPVREVEAYPGDEHARKKSADPSSKERRRSSSKPRKHSAEAGANRPRGLSAVEESDGKAPKSATERSPSSNKRGSGDKNHHESGHSSPKRGSVSSSKDKKEKDGKESKDGKDGTYEKKAKNFWNRARGNSKPKSPKKESSGNQWSEM